MSARLPNHAQQMMPRAIQLTIAARAGGGEPRAAARSGAMLADLDVHQLRSLAVCLALHVDPLILATTTSDPDPRTVFEAAATDAARRWGIQVDEIRSETRRRDIVEARQVAFYACRVIGLSLPTIGAFAGRDHTTVLHGVTRVGENPRLRRIGLDIAAQLGGRSAA